MTHGSAEDLLVLHAVRLLGVADDHAVARRFALDPAVTKELLLGYQAFGWITWSEFAGIGGWSLTTAGRAENERRLAAELELVAGPDPIEGGAESGSVALETVEDRREVLRQRTELLGEG